MVSQPEPSSTSLALRGPGPSSSSVISSRTRRYNRSHAGGRLTSSSSSYGAQNEFPVFSATGDVEIIVRVGADNEGTVERRYLLHRDTLTRCSGFFEASTSVEWSRAKDAIAATAPLALAGGNEVARIGEDPAANDAASTVGGGPGVWSGSGNGPSNPKKMWRYELDPGSGDEDIPMLVQRDELSRSTATTASQPLQPSLFGTPPSSGTSKSNRNADRSRTSSSSYRDSSYPLSRSSKGGGGSHNHHSHSSSLSSSSNHKFFRSVANLALTSHGHHQHHHQAPSGPRLTLAEEDLLRDYDNLFRIFYNYPPLLDGVNIADAYVQCKSLLTLADQYDALAVVGPRVDHHLLQFQSRLWKQIAKYPISYLRLGYLARSRVVFQEALIHVVGQWPAGERSLRAALPDIVLDIIEDKVDELEEAVGRVEGRLFRLGLLTSRGERVSPATHYLDWLAVSLFRQWLADNTSPPPPQPQQQQQQQQQPSSDRRSQRPISRESSRPSAIPTQPAAAPPPPSSPSLTLGRVFRTLGSANPSAYLGHDECKRFLKLTPDMYSRDNLRRFEKRLEEIKDMARDIVRPLMGSGLELDLGGGRSGEGAIQYLTCTSVRNRDLPWLLAED